MERVKAWRARNKERYQALIRYHTAMRHAHIKQATPAWADLAKIKEFYKNCPADHHVDHIVPLRGKSVSGLHIFENLQYLPKAENMRKSNKWSM